MPITLNETVLIVEQLPQIVCKSTRERRTQQRVSPLKTKCANARNRYLDRMKKFLEPSNSNWMFITIRVHAWQDICSRIFVHVNVCHLCSVVDIMNGRTTHAHPEAMLGVGNFGRFSNIILTNACRSLIVRIRRNICSSYINNILSNYCLNMYV